MALPQNVTEAYLAGSSPEIREFWRTVEKRAPKEMQSRVSEFTSSITKGKCYFRDAEGSLLWETPDPPAPVEPPAPVRAPAPSTKQLQTIEARLKMTQEMFLEVTEAITTLHERLQAIEVQTAGMQKRIDQERRGIAFRGHWQVSIDYEKGSIVTYKRCAYIASKTIQSGGETPLRNGSGWLHMFDETEVPHE